jgi:hypothetical protein
MTSQYCPIFKRILPDCLCLTNKLRAFWLFNFPLFARLMLHICPTFRLCNLFGGAAAPPAPPARTPMGFTSKHNVYKSMCPDVELNIPLNFALPCNLTNSCPRQMCSALPLTACYCRSRVRYCYLMDHQCFDLIYLKTRLPFDAFGYLCSILRYIMRTTVARHASYLKM